MAKTRGDMEMQRKPSDAALLTFIDSFIYTCDFCGKIPEYRSQLEVHLDEDHDIDASEIVVDDPPFRLRKLDLYKIKLEGLGVDLEHLSILDLIERPWWVAESLLENLNEKQQRLCMDIRQRERQTCCEDHRRVDASRELEEDSRRMSSSRVLEDPLESEYRQLQAAVAQKRKEYESNLKINADKAKELAYWRQKVSEMKNCSDS